MNSKTEKTKIRRDLLKGASATLLADVVVLPVHAQSSPFFAIECELLPPEIPGVVERERYSV